MLVTSCTTATPLAAAIRAAISRPFAVEAAMTRPSVSEPMADAHAPPSKDEKQSPSTEMTLATPDNAAASAAPMPPAHNTVAFPPAAPTNWAVTGCRLFPDVSAMIVTISIPPQITFASSRNLLTTVETLSAPSNF